MQCEIDYLRKAEWAQTAEDVLDRRTKHGLHLTPEQRAAVVALHGRLSASDSTRAAPAFVEAWHG